MWTRYVTLKWTHFSSLLTGNRRSNYKQIDHKTTACTPLQESKICIKIYLEKISAWIHNLSHATNWLNSWTIRFCWHVMELMVYRKSLSFIYAINMTEFKIRMREKFHRSHLKIWRLYWPWRQCLLVCLFFFPAFVSMQQKILCTSRNAVNLLTD